MEAEFINPNWHVLLIHYPIALLTTGIALEFFGLLLRRRQIQSAARWMILIGALMSLPVAATGAYAFRDAVVSGAVHPHTPWAKIVEQSQWSDVQWQFMTRHVWLNSIATLLFIAVVVAWVVASEPRRRIIYWPAMFALVVGLALMTAGAWHGGEAVYRFATAVEPAQAGGTDVRADEQNETAQQEDARPDSEADARQKDEAGHADLNDQTNQNDHEHENANQHEHENQNSPGQQPEDTNPEVANEAKSETGPEEEHHQAGPDHHAQNATSSAHADEHEHEHADRTGGIKYFIRPLQLHITMVGFLYALTLAAFLLTLQNWKTHAGLGGPGATGSGLWLATFIGALLVALAGLWATMQNFDAESWRRNFEMLRDSEYLRLITHVAFGTSIVILLLAITLAVKFAPRSRIFAKVLLFLLFIAVVFQTWLGVLMLYDSRRGPLTGYSLAAATQSEVHAQETNRSKEHQH